jgi:hypothetical protein
MLNYFRFFNSREKIIFIYYYKLLILYLAKERERERNYNNKLFVEIIIVKINFLRE